jgi:hypothetical protein
MAAEPSLAVAPMVVDTVVAITVDIGVATMADTAAITVTAVGMAVTTPGAGDGVASVWGFISQPCRIITRPIGTAAFLTTTRTIRTSCGIPRWANIGP